MKRFLPLYCCLLLSVVSAAQAEEASQMFSKKVRPLLESKCFDCHSSRADEVKSGLKLDTIEDVLRGGANGPAVVAGDLQSFLLKAIRYEEADYQMPPAGRMSDEEIGLLEQWVKELAAAANKRQGRSADDVSTRISPSPRSTGARE